MNEKSYEFKRDFQLVKLARLLSWLDFPIEKLPELSKHIVSAIKTLDGVYIVDFISENSFDQTETVERVRVNPYNKSDCSLTVNSNSVPGALKEKSYSLVAYKSLKRLNDEIATINHVYNKIIAMNTDATKKLDHITNKHNLVVNKLSEILKERKLIEDTENNVRLLRIGEEFTFKQIVDDRIYIATIAKDIKESDVIISAKDEKAELLVIHLRSTNSYEFIDIFNKVLDTILTVIE